MAVPVEAARDVQALMSDLEWWAAVGCVVPRGFVPSRRQSGMSWGATYRLDEVSVASRRDEKDELQLVSDCGRGLSGRLVTITGTSEQTALGIWSCALATLRSKRARAVGLKRTTSGRWRGWHAYFNNGKRGSAAEVAEPRGACSRDGLNPCVEKGGCGSSSRASRREWAGRGAAESGTWSSPDSEHANGSRHPGYAARVSACAFAASRRAVEVSKLKYVLSRVNAAAAAWQSANGSRTRG
jgi:hypothetical protein